MSSILPGLSNHTNDQDSRPKNVRMEDIFISGKQNDFKDTFDASLKQNLQFLKLTQASSETRNTASDRSSSAERNHHAQSGSRTAERKLQTTEPSSKRSDEAPNSKARDQTRQQESSHTVAQHERANSRAKDTQGRVAPEQKKEPPADFSGETQEASEKSPVSVAHGFEDSRSDKKHEVAPVEITEVLPHQQVAAAEQGLEQTLSTYSSSAGGLLSRSSKGEVEESISQEVSLFLNKTSNGSESAVAAAPTALTSVTLKDSAGVLTAPGLGLASPMVIAHSTAANMHDTAQGSQIRRETAVKPFHLTGLEVQSLNLHSTDRALTLTSDTTAKADSGLQAHGNVVNMALSQNMAQVATSKIPPPAVKNLEKALLLGSDARLSAGEKFSQAMLKQAETGVLGSTSSSEDGGALSKSGFNSGTFFSSGVFSTARLQMPVNIAFGQRGWSELVAERSAMMAAQSIKFADLQLDPPELGQLQVKVAVNHDQAAVSIIAPNQQVKEALDQTIARLRELLGEQGLDLVDVDVSDQSSSQANADDSAVEDDTPDAFSETEEDDDQPEKSSASINVAYGIDHYA